MPCGVYQTFGIDEPSGCYDDIELTGYNCNLGFKYGRDAPNPMVKRLQIESSQTLIE